MKLSTVRYAEYDGEDHKQVFYELDPDELSVEEFTVLRDLLDRSGLMFNRERHLGELHGEHAVSIQVDTKNDGLREVILDDQSLQGEYEKLASFVKALGQKHYRPDAA